MALRLFIGLMVWSMDITLLQLQEKAFSSGGQSLFRVQGQQRLASTVIPVRNTFDPAMEPIEDTLGAGS